MSIVLSDYSTDPNRGLCSRCRLHSNQRLGAICILIRRQCWTECKAFSTGWTTIMTKFQWSKLFWATKACPEPCCDCRWFMDREIRCIASFPCSNELWTGAREFCCSTKWLHGVRREVTSKTSLQRLPWQHARIALPVKSTTLRKNPRSLNWSGRDKSLPRRDGTANLPFCLVNALPNIF